MRIGDFKPTEFLTGLSCAVGKAVGSAARSVTGSGLGAAPRSNARVAGRSFAQLVTLTLMQRNRADEEEQLHEPLFASEA